MAQERFLDPPLPDIIAQWQYYLRALQLQPGHLILDIGCHSGDAERQLLREYPAIAKVIGIDVKQKALDEALAKWLRLEQRAGEDELARWLADLAAQAARGSFFYSINRYLCVCQK